MAALVAITAAVVTLAAASALHRRRQERLWSRTGPAEWIWYARASRTPQPLRFYATREVKLAAAPARARALFFVDPEYVLYVNGRRIAAGSQRPGDSLAVVDLAPHLNAGENRVAIEARSPDGVGGILFAAEGDGLDPRDLASGPAWRVSLDPEAVTGGGGKPAIVWGRPPQYPWGYPRPP